MYPLWVQHQVFYSERSIIYPPWQFALSKLMFSLAVVSSEVHTWVSLPPSGADSPFSYLAFIFLLHEPVGIFQWSSSQKFTADCSPHCSQISPFSCLLAGLDVCGHVWLQRKAGSWVCILSSGLLGYITVTCPNVRGTQFGGSRHHHHLAGWLQAATSYCCIPATSFKGGFVQAKPRFQLVISERERGGGRGAAKKEREV